MLTCFFVWASCKLIADECPARQETDIKTTRKDSVTDAIYQLLNGEKAEDVLTPVELITKENVEEFGIYRWQ